jgi:hypothetical protein
VIIPCPLVTLGRTGYQGRSPWLVSSQLGVDDRIDQIEFALDVVDEAVPDVCLEPNDMRLEPESMICN